MICGATIHISRNPDYIRFRLEIRPMVISSIQLRVRMILRYLYELAFIAPRHGKHSMLPFDLEMRPDPTRMSSGSCTMGPYHLTDYHIPHLCLLYRPKVCLKITFYVVLMI